MNILFSRELQIAIATLSVVVLASLSFVPWNAAAETTISIDQVITAGDYRNYAVQLKASETVSIDLDVQSGSNLSFYFVDLTGLEEFKTVRSEGSGIFTFVTSLSEINTASMHKSEPAPAEGIFYLVITNDVDLDSRVAGTIKTSTQFPAVLFTVAIVALAAILAVAIIAAVVITRSLRAKAHQYVPPGHPTPQEQTHQHMAPKPVVQPNIKQACPKCGAGVAHGATICANCGARL